MNIIYGASIIGKIVLQNCKQRNIPIDYFCDESNDKIGTFIDGVKVIHPSKVDKIDARWIIAVIDIKSIVANILQDCDWENCLDYIGDFDTDDVFTSGVVNMCIFTHRAFQATTKLLVSNVDLVITEKCSLRCKDCANLMQYYSKPQNIDIEVLCRAIDRFCDLADEIQEFRIIGGETLVNKDHHLILEKVLSKPNVHCVVVYTNGTINIPPSKLSYYQDSRVVVSITDYGHLSKNLAKLVQALTQHGVKYHIQTFDDWFDCGRVIPYQTKNVYHLCCGKDLLTILYDKVYKCPFIAHGINMGMIPKYKQDYLDLFETDPYELKDFIHSRVPQSCHHCNGRIYGQPKIKPFVQLH